MRQARSHMVRDIIQSRLLGAIFSHAVRGEMALKGGFAMRVLAGSERFTKDIDLAASPAVPVRAIQGYIRKAIKDLQSTGMISNLKVSEPKQTETTQRWKIGGNVGDSELHLTVEISRREELDQDKVVEKDYSSQPGHMPPVTISCIDMPSIAAAKLSCLANDTREAPRDVYDMYLLITMEVRPPLEALLALGEERLRTLRDQVMDKMVKMTHETAQRELAAYLPTEAAKALTWDAWNEMRLVVDDRLGSWVEEALSGMVWKDKEERHDHDARELVSLSL